MSGPLVRRQQIEREASRHPARMDYEIRGLRCPVDRCDGELDVASYHITTEPRFMREAVMGGTHYRTSSSLRGWVEIEYLCLGCGSSGRMKAWMKSLPETVMTEQGRKRVIHLGPPPPGGL